MVEVVLKYMTPLTIVSSLLLAIAGLYLLKFSKEKGLRAFSLLLVFAFVLQLIQIVLIFLDLNGTLLFYIYPPVEYVLITIYFYELEKEYRSIIKPFSIGFGIMLLVLSGNSINGYPLFSLILLYLFLTILSVRIYLETKKLVVFGLLLFFSLESIILCGFLEPILDAPRILQFTINLTSNIIILAGLYGEYNVIRVLHSSTDSANVSV